MQPLELGPPRGSGRGRGTPTTCLLGLWDWCRDLSRLFPSWSGESGDWHQSTAGTGKAAEVTLEICA